MELNWCLRPWEHGQLWDPAEFERGSETVYCWALTDRDSYVRHSNSTKLNPLLSYSQKRGQKKIRENNKYTTITQQKPMMPDENTASEQAETDQKLFHSIPIAYESSIKVTVLLPMSFKCKGWAWLFKCLCWHKILAS